MPPLIISFSFLFLPSFIHFCFPFYFLLIYTSLLISCPSLFSLNSVSFIFLSFFSFLFPFMTFFLYQFSPLPSFLPSLLPPFFLYYPLAFLSFSSFIRIYFPSFSFFLPLLFPSILNLLLLPFLQVPPPHIASNSVRFNSSRSLQHVDISGYEHYNQPSLTDTTLLPTYHYFYLLYWSLRIGWINHLLPCPLKCSPTYSLSTQWLNTQVKPSLLIDERACSNTYE